MDDGRGVGSFGMCGKVDERLEVVDLQSSKLKIVRTTMMLRALHWHLACVARWRFRSRFARLGHALGVRV